MNSLTGHKKTGFFKLACAALLVFAASTGTAHDTNTTHPRITALAGDILSVEDVQNDMGAYAELLRTDNSGVTRLFWGHDPMFNQDEALVRRSD